MQVSQSTLNCVRQSWCAHPSIYKYSLYGRNDQTIAQFLRACQPTTCPCCGDSTTAHVRNFFHGGQRLSLSVFSLGRRDRVTNPAVPGGSMALPDDDIWLWVRVKNRADVSRKASRKLRLSATARCLSFAHFLELYVSMASITIAGATLNRCVALYFKVGNCIVCLNPNLNRPFSMVIPSAPMDTDSGAYGLNIQREAVALLLVRVCPGAHDGSPLYARVTACARCACLAVHSKSPYSSATSKHY